MFLTTEEEENKAKVEAINHLGTGFRYRVPLRDDYKYYAIIKGVGEEQAVDSPDIM